MAPRFRAEAVNELGDRVATPGANGFLELVNYKPDRGRWLLCSLVQGIDWNAGPLATLTPAGVVWQARLLEGGAANVGTERDFPIRKKDKNVPWTLGDGRPVVRNLLVEPGVTLQWGLNVTDYTTIPAQVSGFFGGIVGFLVDEDLIGTPEFYALLSKP